MSSVTRVGEECTEEVRELIDVCMRTNVDERPSAMDIVHRLQVPSFFICLQLCVRIFIQTYILWQGVMCLLPAYMCIPKPCFL